jgi:hypothetical protein
LLSICASCKKIRDEQSHWGHLETHIRDRSAADFSHSLCPDCLQSRHPRLARSLRTGCSTDLPCHSAARYGETRTHWTLRSLREENHNMQTPAAGGVWLAKPAPSALARYVSKIACWLSFALLGFFCFALTARSQTSDADSNKSWTATTDSQDPALGSRTRKVESHTQSGNRAIDKQSVEILRSGSFEPYQDIERESVKVSDTSVRNVVRTYGRDANGQRVLLQVTEEGKQALPGGSSMLVRTTSNPDANGSLQVVQREVHETKKTSPTIDETKTTVFLPSANGGLAPARRIEERQERIGDHTVQFQKSTLLPDGAGNWQLGEIKKGITTDDGNNRTSEEHVSRQNAEGQLAEVSRTVRKDSQSASGEGRSTVESYSLDVPGSSPDGTMRLVERITTVRSDRTNGAQTSQQWVEQINPGDPSAGLQVTIGSTGSTSTGISGTQETRTIEMRGADGLFNVVSVDMTKSDKTPAVQVQIAPSAKPK